MYSTLDSHGFWASTIMEPALEYMPQAVKDTLVKSVPPTPDAGHMKAWWWDAEAGAWVDKHSNRGHVWYNPNKVDERILIRDHISSPPTDWVYLPPGMNIEPSEAERLAKAWTEVKVERNKRLTASDWTQLPDVPEATRQRWATYRQSLRDITEQTDPAAIVWPEKP